jgi:neutral ceramidase
MLRQGNTPPNNLRDTTDGHIAARGKRRIFYLLGIRSNQRK